jgi:hypothetical protein
VGQSAFSLHHDNRRPAAANPLPPSAEQRRPHRHPQIHLLLQPTETEEEKPKGKQICRDKKGTQNGEEINCHLLCCCVLFCFAGDSGYQRRRGMEGKKRLSQILLFPVFPGGLFCKFELFNVIFI